MNTLDGRVAIVARPGSGIGRATALALAACASALLVACAGSSLTARGEVSVADRVLVTSPHPPEPEEDCRELERRRCLAGSTGDVTRACAEWAKESAAVAGASYIQVDTPAQSARPPVAVFFRCEQPARN